MRAHLDTRHMWGSCCGAALLVERRLSPHNRCVYVGTQPETRHMWSRCGAAALLLSRVTCPQQTHLIARVCASMCWCPGGNGTRTRSRQRVHGVNRGRGIPGRARSVREREAARALRRRHCYALCAPSRQPHPRCSPLIYLLCWYTRTNTDAAL